MATYPIKYVFVVMLENHSFDNVFAMAQYKDPKTGNLIPITTTNPGINVATSVDFNTAQDANGISQPHYVTSPLLSPMTTDPGHEFNDVIDQLCGPGAQTAYQGGSYPPAGFAIGMTGFAANYATSTTEGTPAPPAPSHIGDVMACGYPSDGALLWLAANYVVCDNWFSSMPGPTWPNRFFLHGASSCGMDDSPTTAQELGWEGNPLSGFQYPNGSIFDALNKQKIKYRIYSDYSTFPDYCSLYTDCPGQTGPTCTTGSGAIPQVCSIYNVSNLSIASLKSLATDLNGSYPYQYTFIEPHYGNLFNNYQCGSSQHPMDAIYAGDQLLFAVYQAISKSRLWESSMLIVLYDEHGGFYDHVAPPQATPPGDAPAGGYNPNYNRHGFAFDRYGPRVPAVVVSPWVSKGTVDHTLYDHTSVLATLEELWGIPPLTNRDKSANHLLGLLNSACRTEALVEPSAAPPRATSAPAPADGEASGFDSQPLPESGNLVGALYVARKADLELAGQAQADVDAVHTRFAGVRTRGDARGYIKEVLDKVGSARNQGDAASPAGSAAS